MSSKVWIAFIRTIAALAVPMSGYIAKQLVEINTTMAVIVQQNHEDARRLSSLEQWRDSVYQGRERRGER